MQREQADVARFMTIAGQPRGDKANPVILPDGIEGTSIDTIALLLHAQAVMLELCARLKYCPGMPALRARLLIEETAETVGGIATNDLEAVADGLADLQYVLLGANEAFGIDMKPVWSAVHAANLAKFPACGRCYGHGEVGDVDSLEPDNTIDCPDCQGTGHVVLRDAQGKVMKPAGWQPPDIGAVLRAQKSAHAKPSNETSR